MAAQALFLNLQVKINKENIDKNQCYQNKRKA
jgi:hypothetical protein